MDQEFELKLVVMNGDLRSVASHPVLQSASAERTMARLVATYWDTERGDLARRRISLRVRRENGRIVHTLKRASGSRIKRDEWERESPATEPDLSWARGTPVGSWFEAIEDRALVPRFTVTVARTVLSVQQDDATFEVALDRGEIGTGEHRPRLCEIEIERRTGKPAQAFVLARALARTLPLNLTLMSKAERGFALANGSLDCSSKALSLDLPAAGTVADVFGAIVQECLHGLTRNAALIDVGRSDPEPVHHARILLRHVRAAIALFRPVLRRRRHRTLHGELKWISDRLGEARDADVFLRDHGWGRSTEAARTARQHAYRELAVALGSSRWRLLLIDLAAFSIQGVRRTRRSTRCAPFIAKRLVSTHAHVCKSAHRLKKKSAVERHHLRKSAKMLRYSLDFFETAIPPGLCKRAVRQVSRQLHILQETLGTLHDREEAASRLASLGPAPDDGPIPPARKVDLSGGDELQAAAQAARRLRRVGFSRR